MQENSDCGRTHVWYHPGPLKRLEITSSSSGESMINRHLTLSVSARPGLAPKLTCQNTASARATRWPSRQTP